MEVLPLPARDPEDRRSIASIAGHISWGKTVDRTARTSTPRQAFLDRFDAEVPAEITDPAARAAAAENLRTAYFKQLARKSAETRKAKAGKRRQSRTDGGGRAA